MTCDTLVKIDLDGQKHYKSKIAFNTLDAAIAEAKKQNALDEHTEKVVSYKCTYCYKYHIGRNGKILTPKEKEKLKAEFKANKKTMRIVGWIDLSQIRY